MFGTYQYASYRGAVLQSSEGTDREEAMWLPFANWVEYHRAESLLDEYRRLLREHGAAYDERYLA